MQRLGLIFFFLMAACQPDRPAQTETYPVPIKSGYDFLTLDTQSLQDDDFANPGMLWVERGEALFNTDCTACHAKEDFTGAAASFPRMKGAELINLEGRINLCRTEQMSATPLPYESDGLLSLTSFVAHQATGQPITADTTGTAAAYYARGRDYFYTRRGQFNLSCAECHNDNWGKKLRGDTISQGHGNGFPAYRFEWESAGSLHRRFADCDRGVRAEPRALGSDDYLNLELYLAARANGLAVEAPAVRR